MSTQWPKAGSRSRHGEPVRSHYKTACRNRRLSFAVAPASLSLPGRCEPSRYNKTSDTTNRCSFIQTSILEVWTRHQTQWESWMPTGPSLSAFCLLPIVPDRLWTARRSRAGCIPIYLYNALWSFKNCGFLPLQSSDAKNRVLFWRRPSLYLSANASLRPRSPNLAANRPLTPLNPFHDIGVVNHVLARQGGKRAVKNEHHKCHDHKN